MSCKISVSLKRNVKTNPCLPTLFFVAGSGKRNLFLGLSIRKCYSFHFRYGMCQPVEDIPPCSPGQIAEQLIVDAPELTSQTYVKVSRFNKIV